LEEKVEEMEKKLSKKTETIETLEISIDDLEKKVKCIQDVRVQLSFIIRKIRNLVFSDRCLMEIN